MPPAYTSNPGGTFNSGVYPDTRPQVDVGQILAAAGQGVGSILHAIMQRKVVERQAEMAQAEFGLREKAEKRQADQALWERGFREKELGVRRDTERRNALIAGIVPEVPERITTTDVELPQLAPPRTSIRDALKTGAVRPPRGTTLESLPGPQITPSAGAAPSTRMTARQHDIQMAQPEHYDPTKASAYVRATDLEQMRAEARADLQTEKLASAATLQASRLAAAQQLKVYASNVALEIARIRARAAAAGRSGIAGRMTGGQLETMRTNAAIGLIEHTAGSYDEAIKFLNSPDGEGLRKQGVAPQHLMFAHSKYVDRSAAAAGRLITSPLEMDVPEATKTTKDVRTGVGGGRGAVPPADTTGGDTFTPPPAKPTITAAELKQLVKDKVATEAQLRAIYTVTPK